MAVSWPDLKAPLILCKILLAFVPKQTAETHLYVNMESAHRVNIITLTAQLIKERGEINVGENARRGESFPNAQVIQS